MTLRKTGSDEATVTCDRRNCDEGYIQRGWEGGPAGWSFVRAPAIRYLGTPDLACYCPTHTAERGEAAA
jgi:hypothetical protein